MATVEEHLDDRPETALLFNRPNTAEAPLPHLNRVHQVAILLDLQVGHQLQ
jgi:hypothetical protein